MANPDHIILIFVQLAQSSILQLKTLQNTASFKLKIVVVFKNLTFQEPLMLMNDKYSKIERGMFK
jgi:hypothetical protein